MNIKETLAIIEALAEGVDPITGEILPHCSPYHESRVIRALYTAAQQLRQQLSQAELPKVLPAKAGSPWSEEEDQKLLEEFEANLPIRAIADRHQRTRGAIQSRLVRLGLIDPTLGHQPPEVGSKPPQQWWKEQGRTQAGKPWTTEEDEMLLRDFRLGVPLEALATSLKRGVTAIEVRLAKLGIQSGGEVAGGNSTLA